MTDCGVSKAKEALLPPLKDLMVLIVHNDVSQSENPSECDVLDEVKAVAEALEHQGIPHTVIPLPDPRDLGSLLHSAPHGAAGTVVWNLFENTACVWFAGTFLECAVPIGAEICGHGCVGADSLALWLTTNKADARYALEKARVRIPLGTNFAMECSEEEFLSKMRKVFVTECGSDVLGYDVLAKPTCSDGSEGIEWDKSIFHKGDPILKVWERVKVVFQTMKMDCLVEELVGDSELNVSIIQDPEIRVAAVADIDFSPVPEGYPRIVDFDSKWTPESPMYLSTRRVPSDLDEETLELVKDLAIRAFKATGMRDFGRVDMRCNVVGRHIDPDKIWILEVNANPCVSPGSGFHDGIVVMGNPFDVFVRNMVIEAYKRSKDYASWLKKQ